MASTLTKHTVRRVEVSTVVTWRVNPSSPIWSVRACSRDSWIGRRKS